MTTANHLISAFPFARVELARETVAKSYARLAKAAARAGATVPAEPVLNVVNERTVITCSRCRSHGDEGLPCENCGEGVCRPRRVCDIEVVIDSAKLAGWEFLAVVEPLAGGNLVNRVPGSDESVDLTAYRTHDGSCDHCRTVRRRNETFIVRSTGDDPAIPAGEVKCVGRNCLKAFLGGASTTTILWRLSIDTLIGGCAGEEGGGGGGRGEEAFSSVDLLTWTAAAIRADGWVSKGAARAYNEAAGEGAKVPTVATALYCLVPPWDRNGLREWKNERERLAPTADDTAKAEAALAWARNLTGTSDYEYKLTLVAKGDSVIAKHAGLLASAVAGYERHLGKEFARQNRALLNAQSKHVGAVGDKIVVKVTCEGCASIDTNYGVLHINRFRDETGNVIVWKTGSAKYDTGWTGALKGTIKEHGEYKGTAQTLLTRCSEVDPNAPVKAKKTKKTVQKEDSK